ncbi:MAG: flagellar filament capping protein FliD, partial [Spirochaetaceae bacterium]|nr:flagellar filament capping protein FliD [Spirochaetaceae bacterium]
ALPEGRMSDLSIPGVGSSKYQSDKLIEGLMKLERVPRDKAAERLKDFGVRKDVWLEMNRRLTTLRDEARALYSFKNPFSARVAKSSDEAVLTATATREALEQSRSVLVKRAAAADRFLSADLPKDYKVPAGTYGFAVGDKSLELRFAGGSLQEFADALGRKGRDLVKASVVTVKPDTKALVVESQKTGLGNRLTFSGDAEKFALEAGLLERVGSRAAVLDPARPAAWERGLDARLAKAEGGVLSVATGGEAKLPLDRSAKTQGLVLELEYRLIPLPESPRPVQPPGPTLNPVGEANYEDIVIQGAPSAAPLPDWSPPPEPPRVTDRGMAFALGPDGSAKPLPALEDSGETTKLRVELGGLLPDLAALAFRNRDTSRRLEVVSARVYDPAETGGFKPKRPVSTAQDAIVAVDGIEVTRPTNEIADIVPGVTLNVKAAGDKPVRLDVAPDREAVKEAVIALVGNYNRLMAEINILSRADERLITEISYFTDEEKKAAKEKLGLFQGDSTLSLLRTSLQRTMMNPYETRAGDAMALLSQLGVATDARRPGGGQGFEVNKMRGYLEIEEDVLDKALAENFEAARELFGSDSDGDLIVDSGAAFAIDSLMKPYVETGGIVTLKTRTLDTQIASEKRVIEDLDRQLARKEDELKRKYGMMEGALNRMEGSSSQIDNFTKQQGGN